MMAPSTMLSGGTGSMPKAVTLQDLPEPLDFDGLDRARADVQTDDCACSAKHFRTSRGPLLASREQAV